MDAVASYGVLKRRGVTLRLARSPAFRWLASLSSHVEKVARDSIGSIRQAEGDIHDFLGRYSSDRRAKKYRGYQQRIELDDLQRCFERGTIRE